MRPFCKHAPPSFLQSPTHRFSHIMHPFTLYRHLLVIVTLFVIWQASVTSSRLMRQAEPAWHFHRIVSRALTQDVNDFQATNFTHIVVGGGTAGLSLAVRLSEVQTNTVGVIEAGPSGLDDLINKIPARFGSNLNTQYDWNFTTTPSSTGGVKSVPWPRGHVLGGSSVLNFMVWDRASTPEYDAWEQLGNTGWNAKTMFKYMRKAEAIDAPSADEQKALNIHFQQSTYGTSGPVKISFPRYVPKQLALWIPALRALGVPVNDDPLSGRNVGAAVHPSDIDRNTGFRSSSATAYYVPNASRKNLKVLTSALATRIVFDSRATTTQEANGVEFVMQQQNDASKKLVRASKEVILAAGSVNSPQLLELSGIGRKDVLDAAGIKQIVALDNVGENLQDHTYLSMAFELQPDASIRTFDTLRFNKTFATEQQALFDQDKPSILAQATNSITYLTLPQLIESAKEIDSMLKDAQPQQQTAAAANSTAAKVTLLKQLDFLQKYRTSVTQMEIIGINGYFANTGTPKPNTSYMTLLAAQQHLVARGSVHTSSNDARRQPLIKPNYFTNAFDQRISVAGLQFLRNVARSSPFASGFVRSEATPGASADLQSYARSTLQTEYHPVGTCSMLPRTSGGVVDTELRVYGTSNVRVVDDSIIPLHVGAHIQATVYGIAEVAADILKGVKL